MISILIISLLISTMEYLGIPYNIGSILITIVNFIIIFLLSYINCINQKFVIKSSIVFSMKIIGVLLVLNIITKLSFRIDTLIYYIIILIINALSTLSYILINKEKEKSCSI